MGFESYDYFSSPDAVELDEALRADPLFHRFVPASGVLDARYEFRAPENPGVMPDAYGIIDGDRLYFCDCGGRGSEVLQRLCTSGFGRLGTIRIEEL